MDTDNSFYFLSGAIFSTFSPRVSKRNIIQSTGGYYRPFQISTIGSRKIALTFDNSRRTYSERTVVYKTDTGELIQDLNPLTKNQ